MGSTSPYSVDKNSHTIQDWVEDVEEGDGREVPQQYPRKKEYDRKFRDSEGREYDRPSKPNSRDSRVSKESHGSKESKGIIFRNLTNRFYKMLKIVFRFQNFS